MKLLLKSKKFPLARYYGHLQWYKAKFYRIEEDLPCGLTKGEYFILETDDIKYIIKEAYYSFNITKVEIEIIHNFDYRYLLTLCDENMGVKDIRPND